MSNIKRNNTNNNNDKSVNLKNHTKVVAKRTKSAPANNLILALSTVAAISTFTCSSIALAAVNPTNLVQANYWYHDDDIRTILQNRLDTASNYIAPALPFESQVLLTDVIRASVNEARNLGTALVPVNFNNSHWAALAIKRTSAGTIKVIYNDSLGSPIGGKANGQLLQDILQQIDPTIQIVDLQVHQQKDGSSCGAFTAENLIKIAELDVSNLSDAELRAVLASINDAAAIRNSHFYLLNGGKQVVDVVALKPKAQMIGQELVNQNQHLASTLLYANHLTHDRMNILNRSNSLNGLSSGDDALIHGIWIKGFVGNGKDKGSVVLGNVNHSTNSKSKLHGVILGIDTKIDEDTTIGAAFNYSASKTKNRSQELLTSTDNISSNIFTVYGSGYIDDDITLNANVAYGNTLIKRKNNNNLTPNSSKQKGQLFGSAVMVNYNLYSTDALAITPRLGASYMQAKLKAYKDGSIKISGSKNQELELTGGIAANYFYDFNSFTVIPEINIDYSHAVWHKGNKVKISNSLDKTILTQKLSNNKGIVSFGSGLTIVADRIELGAGYEHNIQGKSRVHIGYVKLRVNF
jgi:hypothetical protein